MHNQDETERRIPGKIWVLIGASFVIAIGYGLVAPILPAYGRSFNVGITAASLLISIFAFFRLVFAPVAGRLATRFGERPVYMTGLVIVSVSMFGMALSRSYIELLVFRSVAGIGATLFTISALALLVRLSPPKSRGLASSAYTSAFLIGGLIGPVVGGLLAEYGMRLPFFVYGVALLVATTVVALGLRDVSSPELPGAPSRPVLTLAEAWRSPVYKAILVGNIAYGWVNFGIRIALLPLLAAAVLDTPWVAGAVLAVGAAGTAGALQAAGRLADRVGRRPLVFVGLTLMGGAIGLIGFSVHSSVDQKFGLIIIFTLSLVSGIGAGFLGPAQQAAVADVIGNDRSGGSVLSVFQMTQDVGAILGPIMVGLIADQVGYIPAFLVTGIVTLLCMIPWIFAPEPLRGHS